MDAGRGIKRCWARSRRGAICALGVCVVAVGSAWAAEKPADEGQKPQQFSAVAFGQAGMFAGKSVSMNIYTKSYSSDQEIEELASILQTKGSDALLKSIERMKPKGRVSVTGRTGWNVSVVREHATEKGRRIVMFSNRPISFYELRSAPRSRGYEFGMLVLNVNEKGEGDGLLYGSCKVKFDKDDQLQVEHYGQAPARLANVRLVK